MTGKFANWIVMPLIGLIGGCGILQHKEPEIRYCDAPSRLSLHAVDTGGDFALFYDGQDKPEVPVRVQAGDSVGFIRDDDGRLKAVAGPFKMDMNAGVHEAIWRRMSTIDE